MEGFVTLDMFLNFAFCVAVVSILVELIKRKVTKVDTWIILLLVSLCVMAINFVVKADFTWQGILTALINVVVVAISASGSYEGIKTAFNKIFDAATKKTISKK